MHFHGFQFTLRNLFASCSAAICRAHGVGLAFSMSQSTIYFAYAAIFYLGAYLVENDGLDYVDMMKYV